MVLNRNLPIYRNQSLNLVRPDSTIDPEPTPKSLNELNQLLDVLSKAKETMKTRTTRAASLTPTTSTTTMDESITKNAKSIDDLIESLNNTTETPKSNSKKNHHHQHHHLQNIHQKNLPQPKN
jgi:small-conductance mechanosensitive channel